MAIKTFLKTKVLDLDQLPANSPAPVKEWRKVWRYMDKWPQKHAKSVSRTEIHCWRICVHDYLLVAYNSGGRSTKFCGRYVKNKGLIDRGLIWGDVGIVPQTRLSGRLNKKVEVDPISFLDIRKTKTGVPRELAFGTVVFLERCKHFAIERRKES